MHADRVSHGGSRPAACWRGHTVQNLIVTTHAAGRHRRSCLDRLWSDLRGQLIYRTGGVSELSVGANVVVSANVVAKQTRRTA